MSTMQIDTTPPKQDSSSNGLFDDSSTVPKHLENQVNNLDSSNLDLNMPIPDQPMNVDRNAEAAPGGQDDIAAQIDKLDSIKQ